ncbi:MAG: hypothetical protein KAR20_09785, partial [Candidatus Heimdallarchaeota archaeon]|nr:hypothetical protein [Candidatus Heimdallarchaeota archaeon]
EGIDEDIQPNYNIDKKCRESKLNSYLRIYDISTGEEIITEIIPGAWVTHVQFCPVNNNIILYNNEWCRDGGMRRIWIWDGKNHKKLRSLRDGRDAEDWVSHEVFMPDGESVFYHGIYKNGDAFIGKINVDGANCVEIEMDEGFNAYGHFSLGNNGLLVSDGYYKEKRKGKEIETGILAQCKEIFFRRFKFFLALRYREKIRRMLKSNSKSKGAWISILKVDWQKQIIDWIPLCQHGSSWHFQDDHPHPIFNYDSSEVLFTSDRGKRRAIYRMSISK